MRTRTPDQPSTEDEVRAIFDRIHGRRHSNEVGPVRVVVEMVITIGALMVVFALWAAYLPDIPANAAAAKRLDDFGPPPATGRDYTRHDGPSPEEPDVAHGETMGVLYIPALGDDYQVPIAKGAGQDVLKDAVAGHYASTQRPGQVGNFAVAGHRTTYGKIFYDIEKIEIGDPIVVRTDVAWYVYKVTDTLIVKPWQNEVIAPVPSDPGAEATERMLTITTCHPLLGYSERYIVHAALDHWVDPAEGAPEEVSV